MAVQIKRFSSLRSKRSVLKAAQMPQLHVGVRVSFLARPLLVEFDQPHMSADN